MIAVLLTLTPLLLLIVAAYRGVSVILFAPIAAMLAVLLYPALVPAVFSGVYMGAGDFVRQSAHAAGVPDAVLHRVATMASGGLDTLPHNSAVITLLAVTGLTHRQAYRGIFALTLIKSAAVLVVIAV